MITRLSDALQPCRGTDTSECPNFNRTGGRFRSWNCSLGIFPWGEVVTDYVMHEDLTCGCRIKMASVHFANFNLWTFWGNTFFLLAIILKMRWHRLRFFRSWVGFTESLRNTCGFTIDIICGGPVYYKHLNIDTMWGPPVINRLVYNSNNYGLWYL